MCGHLYVELLEGERRGHALPSVWGCVLHREKPLRKVGVAPCSVPLRVCAHVPVPCVCVTGLGSLREEAENWRVLQIRECYENSEESTESCTRKRDRIEPTRNKGAEVPSKSSEEAAPVSAN